MGRFQDDYELEKWDNTSSPNTIYLLNTQERGVWYIQKIDITTTEILWATEKNNVGKTKALAWTNRLTLSYAPYNEVV